MTKIIASYPALFIGVHPIFGRGVYTAKAIKAGEIIEICPMLVFPLVETTAIQNTSAYEYVYSLEMDDNESIFCTGLALGFGSLYNHSDTPNAFWEYNRDANTLAIIADKDIEEGEEIVFDYGYIPKAPPLLVRTAASNLEE